MPPYFYGDILFAHGAWRWVVILAGAVASLFALATVLRRRAPSLGFKRASSIFAGVVDIELLLGITIYFISPVVQPALSDPHLLLKGQTGFFGLAHTVGMLGAVGVVHLGNVMLRSPQTSRRSFGALAIVTAFAVIVLATPWWRPFIR